MIYFLEYHQQFNSIKDENGNDAIHITVIDSKQFDAYNKLYQKAKKLEVEKEQKRKNDSK